MPSWFMHVQKIYDVPSGRDRDETYVHIMRSAREYPGTFEELTQNVGPWNDPTANDFAVEITEAEFNAIQDGSFPLTWGTPSLPKWQWNLALGQQGSWSDPTDDQSTWRNNTPIPDDRFIVRVFDRDPGDPQAIHLGSEDLTEDPTNLTRFIKLYSQNDVPLNTNASNQLTEIAGKLMVFDFTDGESNFEIGRDRVGTIVFPTNHRYRVVGPAGEDRYIARVFGRVLRAPAE